MRISSRTTARSLMYNASSSRNDLVADVGERYIMITRNGRAQWVVFTSRTSKVLKRVDGIFANLYPDLNNRPVPPPLFTVRHFPMKL